MVYRVFTLFVLTTGLLLRPGSAGAQAAPSEHTLFSLQPNSTSDSKGGESVFAMGSISGTVRSTDNHPLNDARVEIRNIPSGQNIAIGYTDHSGTFRLDNVPNGEYEVVATSGISEAREQLQVFNSPAEITLRLPAITKAVGGPPVVSVQQLAVPQKAKDALAKAQEAVIKNNLKEAEKQVAKALTISPKYADAIAYRGVLSMGQHDFASASNDLQQAIQLDNSNTQAYVAMGALYNLEGKYDDAIREIERGIALNPRLWSAHFEMSKAQLGKGDYNSALKEANQAQALAPGRRFSLIHVIKGQILVGLKLYSGAVKEFKEFLAQEKGDPALAAQVENSLAKLETLAAKQD